ncbi:Uu.00g033500.m01.CDS01 [Anthostomella pinea]|uniref:Uu.00g033500.m01.CDS01 n=1 Tax=Anthostomella pinea TaxID=933095 RepID=A0AAI8V9D5_9PEZI|nr:Uu.00g033500.m01.CDS01 [Anthostomella pinea]
MQLRTTLAVALLPVFATAWPTWSTQEVSNTKRDQSWSFNVYLHKNESCKTEPTVTSYQGSVGCGSPGIKEVGSWKGNGIADGCKVNFYSDGWCGTLVDWMDTQTDKEQCKTQFDGVIQTFDAVCK